MSVFLNATKPSTKCGWVDRAPNLAERMHCMGIHGVCRYLPCGQGVICCWVGKGCGWTMCWHLVGDLMSIRRLSVVPSARLRPCEVTHVHHCWGVCNFVQDRARSGAHCVVLCCSWGCVLWPTQHTCLLSEHATCWLRLLRRAVHVTVLGLGHSPKRMCMSFPRVIHFLFVPGLFPSHTDACDQMG
jgi:hypothetical protein